MNRFFLSLIYILIFSLSAFAESSTKAERNFVIEGNRLFKQEKYHEALEKYEKALATNPSYQFALYNKAVTLTMLATDDNKNTEIDPRKAAAQIFTDIAQLKTNPGLAAKSFYNLGNMAYNDGQFDQAIKMYKGSLRIEPDNRQCRQNLLLAMQKQEEQEQNQDQQDQDQQEQEQEQQQQEQQQQEQQEQQQQQQQPQMTQTAEQLLQTMQNKENATRRRTNQEQVQPAQRSTDKPW